ncbi:MAG TPA: hypothetical protein PLH94_05490 [Fimbriimonadaceae bacterium]|nr:hypothetical protein [Fimbriimonadaceae bacterium]
MSSELVFEMSDPVSRRIYAAICFLFAIPCLVVWPLAVLLVILGFGFLTVRKRAIIVPSEGAIYIDRFFFGFTRRQHDLLVGCAMAVLHRVVMYYNTSLRFPIDLFLESGRRVRLIEAGSIQDADGFTEHLQRVLGCLVFESDVVAAERRKADLHGYVASDRAPYLRN